MRVRLFCSVCHRPSLELFALPRWLCCAVWVLVLGAPGLISLVARGTGREKRDTVCVCVREGEGEGVAVGVGVSSYEAWHGLARHSLAEEVEHVPSRISRSSIVNRVDSIRSIVAPRLLEGLEG